MTAFSDEHGDGVLARAAALLTRSTTSTAS
jgi:hypothetical protein